MRRSTRGSSNTRRARTFALDDRLVKYDALASIAHAQMLSDQGLLAQVDLVAIRQGLESLATEHARGAWQVELEDEDGQTALERRLTARIGSCRRKSPSRPLA